MYEIFVDLLDIDNEGDPEMSEIPAQFHRIIRETLQIKNDIEFGYQVNRSEMTHNQLLGSRAYQRASNHLKAAENARIREEMRNRGNG